MPKTVSAAKAKKVLTAVAEQYPTYVTPGSEPKISTDYAESGQPVVVWEEGPEEWTVAFTRSISASLVSQAEGLFLEPVNHVVLGIYPA